MVPQSYIKNIAIRICDNYQFGNTPLNINDASLNNMPGNKAVEFIGRKKQISKFKEFLYSKSGRGVFLVTGYRGMGKTSFVNKVLHDYRKFTSPGATPGTERSEKRCLGTIANSNAGIYQRSAEEIIPVHLTIAHSNPNEFEILRMIALSIFDQYKQFHKKKIDEENRKKRNVPFLILYIALILLLLGYVFPTDKNVLNYFSYGFELYNSRFAYDFFFLIYPYRLLLLFAGLTFFIIESYRKILRRADEDDLFRRIKWLVERCHAGISEELSNSGEIEFKIFKSSLFSSPKRTKSYPIASVKEIEYELTYFLNQVRHREKLEFIFIFDELDKIEVTNDARNIHSNLDAHESSRKEADYFSQMRGRKQAVINVIASLKNFFTTTEAKFIFIAGRELFDASLADIADKQSSVSSIFTYIFNIESFLKDDGSGDHTAMYQSLSKSIERYLGFVLFGDAGSDNFFQDVKNNFESILLKEEYTKLHFILQSLITYLVYRSNGSPKKLIRAIQEFVISTNEADHSLFTEKIMMVQGKGQKDVFPARYIYINYFDQYRIGFINYLYRPFLIQYGRNFKMYSDNANISIPYLFDHLIKFHPFAFSFSNLELVPESLSANKTPYLRQLLNEIINYLKANHLRETDIELFDYKFYSRTQNEIIFISKTFEEEAAAFNFTLDESYSVKLLVDDKIKELRSIYSKFKYESDSNNQQIFSIAYLNANLGDLHFFDQEFDNAIGCYSDAIKPINNVRLENMNLRDFITLIRNKLKIGLCFEKMNSYEEALAFYSDASQDALRFISYRLQNSKKLKETGGIYCVESPITESDVFLTSSLNDLLQITVQCFLSKIIIQEKMGLEGITTSKVGIAIGSFLKLTLWAGKECGDNHLIIANSFLHLGNLLFYKNSSARTSNIHKHVEETAFFPKEIASRISKLDANRRSCTTDNAVTKREPILAYQMYLVGLDYVMQSRGAFTGLRYNIDENKVADTGSDLISNYPEYNILGVYLKSLFSYVSSSSLNTIDESHTGPYLRYIGTFLSSLGDSILAMHHLKVASNKLINFDNYRKIGVDDLFRPIYDGKHAGRSFYSYIKDNYSDINSNGRQDHFSLMDVLKCYYLSSMFFKKYGRHKSASFQMRKILHLLRVTLDGGPDHDPSKIKEFCIFIETAILEQVKDIANQTIARSNIHMTEKAKKYIEADEQEHFENFLTNHSDVNEARYIYLRMQMRLNEKTEKYFDTIKDEIDKLISPYNMYSTQYSRVLELDFYATYVESYFSELKNTTDRNYSSEFLFSLLSIIRILNIDGQDFMMSPSYIAYTHYRVAKFIEQHSTLIKEKINGCSVQDDIEGYFGPGSYSSLSYTYHYSKAKENYEKAIQLHTAGKEYKKTINEMIYLEDDFNDNAYHFGAAIDRYLMVHGVFNHYIGECDKKLAAGKHG